MATFYNRQHLDFVLFDVHRIQDLCALAPFSEHNREVFDMVLDSADSFAEKRLYPIHMEMDEKEPVLEDGRIKVHPDMKRICREFGTQGWISCNAPYEEGGQQLPFTIAQAASYIMGAANYSATAFYGLSQGASELIRFYGSEEQKQTYVSKLFDGSWQGTMALTEPEAGSSLSDVKTTAVPTAEDHYLIKGQKIFISCGDHDATDNVIHMMLARIEGAPPGVKGISLFIVPQFRVAEDGGLKPNDVLTGGLYHKMGYRGAPIAHIITGENDDCRGYLVGEPNKGLSYMFRMMNGARIMVGLHAVSIAGAAYQASLAYAMERKQGRNIADKDVSKPQVAIIEHADVKRMLLFQKSIVEGSLSLLMQCAQYEDLSQAGEASERERYALMLDLLTPIAKTYPSEMGILTASAAVQIHGGYGYTREYSVEKYFREIRIHTLHEGTTGIHGLDLMGRKIAIKGGAAVMHLMQAVMADIAAARAVEPLQGMAASLSENIIALQEVTMTLTGVAQKEGPEAFLADATIYLELFSINAVAWQWLKMATVAQRELPEAGGDRKQFLESKLTTARFYFEYEVPKTLGLRRRLQSSDRTTVEAGPGSFL